MRRQGLWTVIAEEGLGNTVSYEFTTVKAAQEFFGRLWVARLLVNQNGKEVSASSGWNMLALARLREQLHAMQSAKTRHEACLCKVVVDRLSGSSFENRFSVSATVSEIKDCVAKSWGVARGLQKLVLDATIVEDNQTVASLIADSCADTLHVMMIADGGNSIQADLHDIRKKVRKERVKPTNIKSISELRKLLERAETLEEALRCEKGGPFCQSVSANMSKRDNPY